ncbi:hypothetical protein [Methylobacterium mesophilicum]
MSLAPPKEPRSSEAAPAPSNNLLLRQMDGLRRDMRELMEREARTIELMNRIAVRMDEGFTRIRDDMAYIRRDVGEMRGDLLTMENRVLNAITEVRFMAARVDEAEAELRQAVEGSPPVP